MLPEHTNILIPCESEEESAYIAAMLNSSPVQAIMWGYIVLHPSPHTLEVAGIRQYQSTQQQRQLAEFSIRAHEIAPCAYSGNLKAQAELAEIERQIDEEAAKLWGITPSELKEIQKALKEMERPKRTRIAEEE